MQQLFSHLKGAYGFIAGHEALSFLILILAYGVFAVVFASLFAGVTSWYERRIAGRMQCRIGPNRVGPQGTLQWLADGLKAFLKEDLIPRDADALLFRLAPYPVFAGVFCTWVVLPFSPWLVGADLNTGVLYVMAITALVVAGIIMGGWASNSKWALLGGIRSAAQMVSYEIPAGMALMTAVIPAGTMSLQGIIAAQGGAPWNWMVFSSPSTFFAFFIYMIAALAEGNRTPFDLPEAESELVAGYNTEYSGMRFLWFFFAEWANLYVIGAIMTAVFLGGWRIPGVSVTAQSASLWLQLCGACLFLAKSLLLVNVIIWIRWTLPRLRVDQLMAVCWKYFVPIAILLITLAIIWVKIAFRFPAAAWVTRYVLFFIALLLASRMVSRVIFAIRSGRDKPYFRLMV